jgi:hypothetical protein
LSNLCIASPYTWNNVANNHGFNRKNCSNLIIPRAQNQVTLAAFHLSSPAAMMPGSADRWPGGKESPSLESDKRISTFFFSSRSSEEKRRKLSV